MDTKTAAAKANVTTATIRTWCRRNAVAAVKAGGKWAIDETSLHHRISLTGRRQVAIGTGRCFAGALGADGPADVLAAAFADGTQILITRGPLTGDRVYLKRSGYLAPEGADRTYTDGTALYRLDTDRTGDAPRFEAYLSDGLAQAMEAMRQADAGDRTYLNPRYM